MTSLIHLLAILFTAVFWRPTGKAYRIPMATLGHWNKDGVMFEEFLYWDNGAFMKQIGVGQ